MIAHKEMLLDYFGQTIRKSRILVLGDIMLDRYYFGEVKRISPEAPVPVTRVLKQTGVLGGAGNVAHNLRRLGCQVDLVGLVGADEARGALTELMAASGMHTDSLVESSRPTTTKLRVIGGHQQMMRIDFEETAPISRRLEDKILEKVQQSLDQGAAVIILSDYGKGLCTPRLCRQVIRIASEGKVPVIVDPKGDKWQKYQGASYITPNLKEVGEALKKKVANEDGEVLKAAQTLRKRFSLGAVIATRSEHGLSYAGEATVFHIPTLAQEVFDVSGAGDTVIAVFGAALAGNLPLYEAAYAANLAAGVVVGKVGTYAISQREFVAALQQAVEVKEEVK
ncbi:MAG: D-glycero-beta-D-manno-heptose-7-phosphate kinase [Sporomusaceae bacterium]|nr:D-glycero-beta-D-manno-heptose-7-phosphate kinase [Sporomusaceae bacterium]